MSDLRCNYLGLPLANPLVPSSSPLTGRLDSALRLEDAGAAALVLPSLFEEQIIADELRAERFFELQGIGHGEADSYRPLPSVYRTAEERYLETVAELKGRLGIPVIASLNGCTDGGWLRHARDLEEAGADAIELNMFHLPARVEETAAMVESAYLAVAGSLAEGVSVPVAVKLGSQLSAPLNLVSGLEARGVRGVSLFNRFYQPDIDLETLDVLPQLSLSSPGEALLRVRWAAMLYGQTACSIAVTGGFHHAEDVIKAQLVGADIVHLCSVLLSRGEGVIAEMLEHIAAWLEEREYESLNQLRGSMSMQHAPEPGQLARANYLELLDSYSVPEGVRH
jgi:dihydroorotate dehydrogenase (fumarate)